MKYGLRHLAFWTAAPLLLASGPALGAATLTVTSVSTGPTMGKVAAAATANGGAATTFTISPAGLVTKSGNGGSVSTSLTPVTVTIKCTSAACSAGGNGKITVTGSPTGRITSITNFTVSSSSVSGITTSGNVTTFTLPNAVALNGTETITVGMDVVVAGDSSALASGAATAKYIVEVAAGVATPANPVTGTLTATVQHGLTVTQTTPLTFGRITKPTSGTQTANVNVTTGAFSFTGSGTGAFHLSSPASTAGVMTFSGEGAATFTINAAAPFTLTGPGGATLTATPTFSATSGTMSGAGGSTGTFPLNVGAAIPITSTTTAGAYTGTYSVIAQYN